VGLQRLPVLETGNTIVEGNTSAIVFRFSSFEYYLSSVRLIGFSLESWIKSFLKKKKKHQISSSHLAPEMVFMHSADELSMASEPPFNSS
jgi:hypothetical protein